jgi:hypothetical protein
MQLNEKNAYGEILYECDLCQIVGARDVYIIEEKGRHLCMSCWSEQQINRANRPKAILVEI